VWRTALKASGQVASERISEEEWQSQWKWEREKVPSAEYNVQERNELKTPEEKEMTCINMTMNIVPNGGEGGR